jgi:CheY-like chemotaxis protein
MVPALNIIEVLLVDDNPGDVRLTREALKEARVIINLSVANHGLEAIEMLAAGPGGERYRPDLILLDLNMPVMDGREVLQIIKADPALRSIPVVVLTTSQAERDILQAYDLHANCFITKPVEFGPFMEIVKSIEHFWLAVVKLPNGGPA